MTAFKKEILKHIILLSRCRGMVLLNQYIQQFGTRSAGAKRSAEDTEVAGFFLPQCREEEEKEKD